MLANPGQIAIRSTGAADEFARIRFACLAKGAYMFHSLGGSRLLFLAIASGAVALQAQTPNPVYACVQIAGMNLQSYRLLEIGGTCKAGEQGMLVLKSFERPFALNGMTRPSEDEAFYRAQGLQTLVSAMTGTPVYLAFALTVNGDQGLSVIPVITNLALGVSCIPVVDGQGVGTPRTLALDLAARYMTSAPVNQTGVVMQIPVTVSPDMTWPLLRQYTGSLIGTHRLSLSCSAAAPFRIRGRARVMVLQPVNGN
jgi:hypothetical protein